MTEPIIIPIELHITIKLDGKSNAGRPKKIKVEASTEIIDADKKPEFNNVHKKYLRQHRGAAFLDRFKEFKGIYTAKEINIMRKDLIRQDVEDQGIPADEE